jgi:hypothetical protein
VTAIAVVSFFVVVISHERGTDSKAMCTQVGNAVLGRSPRAMTKGGMPSFVLLFARDVKGTFRESKAIVRVCLYVYVQLRHPTG